MRGRIFIKLSILIGIFAPLFVAFQQCSKVDTSKGAPVSCSVEVNQGAVLTKKCELIPSCAQSCAKDFPFKDPEVLKQDCASRGFLNGSCHNLTVNAEMISSYYSCLAIDIPTGESETTIKCPQ